jgi:hypothetical protein
MVRYFNVGILQLHFDFDPFVFAQDNGIPNGVEICRLKMFGNFKVRILQLRNLLRAGSICKIEPAKGDVGFLLRLLRVYAEWEA